MGNSGALVGLPPVFFELLPELRGYEWPSEQRADCGNCPMVAQPAEEPGRLTFHAEVRCCTYHPILANWQAGGALRRGGTGSARLRARLASLDGVHLVGIDAARAWTEAYLTADKGAFGRVFELRCPFWVAGPLSCSLWEDRNSVCRTWYCKFEAGAEGSRAWSALRRAMKFVEARIAEWCVDEWTGETPVTADEFEAYYIACAEKVDGLSAGILRSRMRDLFPLREMLAEAWNAQGMLLPEVLVPSVQGSRPVAAGVEVLGDCEYDPLVTPASLFVFLAKLDGHARWREVLVDGEWPAEGDVEALYRARVLRAPEVA